MSNNRDKPQKDPIIRRVKTAIVRCKGYRCQATLWSDKKWRDSRGNEVDVAEIMVELG